MIAKRKICVLAVLLALNTAVPTARARNFHLLELLSKEFLGEPNPVEVGDGYGWHAVVFAEEALPDFEWEFASFDGTEAAKQRIRKTLKYLDHPVAVKDGVAIPRAISISEEWIKLTNAIDFSELNSASDDIRFQLVDDIGASFGFNKFQHSPAYQSYLRLERHDQVVNRSLVGENSAWRFVPDLPRNRSVFDVKREIAWKKKFQGWNDEMESLGLVLDLRSLALRILNNNEFVDKDPDVWLAPAPDTWAAANIWQHAGLDLGDQQGSVTFEFARVFIHRPWFLIDEMISGRLKLDKSSVRTTMPISTGEAPSLVNFPSGGLLTIYPEEIIIVRKVRLVNPQGGELPTDMIRPLNFSFGSINLLGFVVRVLPRVPK